MVTWRWDQGRLKLLQFPALQYFAKRFMDLEGHKVLAANSLRSEEYLLLPESYSVWRNYARVFKLSLLAYDYPPGIIRVTDVCRRLADDSLDADQYFGLLIQRFYYPWPVFQSEEPTDMVIFPMVAIIKFLLTRPSYQASLQDIVKYVVSNTCTGEEPLDHYRSLVPSIIGESEYGDHRQLREMLIFFAQASFLKWISGKNLLQLDLATGDKEALDSIEHFVFNCPFVRYPNISRLGEVTESPIVVPTASEHYEAGIFEGTRKMREHFRIERSSVLRQLFLQKYNNPSCDMCGINTAEQYPWTENLIDIHHILPLSHPAASISGTTIDDLIPLCSTCHRAVHVFYVKWLKANDKTDFQSKAQASVVYNAAKREIVRN